MSYSDDHCDTMYDSYEAGILNMLDQMVIVCGIQFYFIICECVHIKSMKRKQKTTENKTMAKSANIL